jgi:hypothetical protein
MAEAVGVLVQGLVGDADQHEHVLLAARWKASKGRLYEGSSVAAAAASSTRFCFAAVLF